ncbi:MAG: MEKHLA domain-containing protein [Betaproteobacteria bacterium]|nr:MEKHLA domain-containing protein [Betaproteobacteria bacterium]
MTERVFRGLAQTTSVQPPRGQGAVRTIHSAGVDLQPCGGTHLARTGRRFWIEDVTVWNLVDAAGRTHGQAATYRSWRDA